MRRLAGGGPGERKPENVAFPSFGAGSGRKPAVGGKQSSMRRLRKLVCGGAPGRRSPCPPRGACPRKTRWLADRKASQRERVAHAPEAPPRRSIPSRDGQSRDGRTLRLTNNEDGGGLAPGSGIRKSVTLTRHAEVRAHSAFTRVFDALWQASKVHGPDRAAEVGPVAPSSAARKSGLPTLRTKLARSRVNPQWVRFPR